MPVNRADKRIKWGERKHLILVMNENARDDLCECRNKGTVNYG